MIDSVHSIRGIVGASVAHDVVLALIYAFCAVLLALPIVMTVVAVTVEVRALERRRLATVCAVSGGLGLTALGAVAVVLSQ